MHKTLDVITIGEAMAMFVATQTGELSAVEHFSNAWRAQS
jgi:2-dehydro-3-deoxygluconokinase